MFKEHEDPALVLREFPRTAWLRRLSLHFCAPLETTLLAS